MKFLPTYRRFDAFVYVNSKLSLILWAVFYSWKPPKVRVEALGYGLIYVTSFFVIIGATTSLLGLRMVFTAEDRTRLAQGQILEVAGIVVALSGPMSGFLTEMYIIVRDGNMERSPFAAFSYALLSVMLTRLATTRRYLKELLP